MLLFKGGAVTGISVASLALLGVSGLFIAFGAKVDAVDKIVGFGLEHHLSAFLQGSEAVYILKQQMWEQTLVGKVEAGIPEDDREIPVSSRIMSGTMWATVRGMAADLFETYAVTALGQC